MIKDTSNEAEVKKAERDFEDREKDLLWILSSPRGRRWLHTLIFETCHADRQSLVFGDNQTTAFNEGGRAVGLALKEEIRARAFDKFLMMLKENQDD